QTLHEPPTPEFVRRVVRMADRWRGLDSDSSAACNAAAQILETAGAKELAWEYLTTPVALRPGESGPWLSMARSLHERGNDVLADRAFAMAFAAEPTNAQILYDRA